MQNKSTACSKLRVELERIVIKTHCATAWFVSTVYHNPTACCSMHQHPYTRIPQGCAHTFCLAPPGSTGDMPVTAGSAHLSSGGGTAATNKSNSNNNSSGPGSALMVQIWQPRHTPRFRRDGMTSHHRKPRFLCGD